MSSRSVTAYVIQTMSNETDRLALLAFKEVLADPSGTLRSWNTSMHHCEWEGVSCGHKHPQRVTALKLPSRSLMGYLAPSLANLTFLRTLYLMENGFHGELPPTLGKLRRLQHFNVSFNSLYGRIPAELSNCSELRVLCLHSNELTGRIPVELGSFSKLQILTIENNSFVGVIPSSLGNLSSLYWLNLKSRCMGESQSSACLEGNIPMELGKLAHLGYLELTGNKLSGMIPSSIFNLSELFLLSAPANQLHGNLPQNMGMTLPSLQYLLLGGNQLSGKIPALFPNSSRLANIDLSHNNFEGQIPSSLGRLQALYWLNLAYNQLEARDAEDWRFMDALTNCSHFRVLGLDHNKLGGVLPNSIANLSTQLQKLLLGANHISGSIPSGIHNLFNLDSLDMGQNHLSGVIPEAIGSLNQLRWLGLFRNRLTGNIPFSVGNLTQLLNLYLFDNVLQGSIPATLGKLQQLTDISLSKNQLSGSIPGEFFTFSYLSNAIDLSHNYLAGTIPVEVGGLKNVRSLVLSGNKLSGKLPTTLGNCESLESLALDQNMFQGEIPPSLSKIKGLKKLNLSYNLLSGTIPSSLSNINGLQELYIEYNNLSGPIPRSLEDLKFMLCLNLSHNHLEGEVPVKGVFGNASGFSANGNDGLCGGIPQVHLPSCPIKSSKNGVRSQMLKVVLPVGISVLCLILLSCSIFLNRKQQSRKMASTNHPMELPFPKVSYAELDRATDGFHSANLIGRGKYGSVYKGTLQNLNSEVAVKVFNLDQRGASKSFSYECDALRIIRHRNLIKIITSCSSIDSKGKDFKALVFEFMPNGSLETWLQPRECVAHHQVSILSLTHRLNLALDVARALEYLHHHCQPPVVHCDLKPSNILLGLDMSARVGDFGLAKLVSEDPTMFLLNSNSSIGIRGTIGYVAPEYGAGGQVSPPGDIYSYGILLLEMLTGKRPTNDMFKDGLTIHKFVEMHVFCDKIMDIVDPSMLSAEEINEYNEEGSSMVKRMEECIASVARLGLSCSKESPSERKNMTDVAAQMQDIRDGYLGVGIHQR